MMYLYNLLLSYTVQNSKATSQHSSSAILAFSEVDQNNFRFGNINGLGNLTVQVGTTAYMHCPVVNLEEREVRNLER